MTLEEFLATASTDSAIALQEAQAYSEQVPELYTANTMTMLIVGAGVYGLLSDTAKDSAHPARDICLALMDRLRAEGEFNFAPSDQVGQTNIRMLDNLITLLPDYSQQLSVLKAQLILDSEETIYPFAGATLYAVLRARGDVPTVPVTPNEQGFVLVTSVGVCPEHSPAIHGINPRTNRPERVGFLRSVAAAGTYECRIAHEHRSWVLSLDNPYGVFGE